MPNIRSMVVDEKGVVIVASDGRVFEITPTQVKNNYAAQIGTEAERKAKTIQWLKEEIEAALGIEQVSAAQIIIPDIEVTTGTVPEVEVRD